MAACGYLQHILRAAGREQQQTSSHIAWSPPLCPSTSAQTSQPSSRRPTTHGHTLLPRPQPQPRPPTLSATSTQPPRHSRLISRRSLPSPAPPPGSSRRRGHGSGRTSTSRQAGDGSPSSTPSQRRSSNRTSRVSPPSLAPHPPRMGLAADGPHPCPPRSLRGSQAPYHRPHTLTRPLLPPPFLSPSLQALVMWLPAAALIPRCLQAPHNPRTYTSF